VRYPDHALRELRAAGIEYGGWLPNCRVPEVFANYRVTLHIPRRPYVRALPGIPTIRPFEAMACGIPLLSAPWEDREHLFRPGLDFLFARDGSEMTARLETVLSTPALSKDLAAHGRETVRARHTCAHRIDELLAVAQTTTELAAAESGS
jgi:spore maturation protein CgeB